MKPLERNTSSASWSGPLQSENRLEESGYNHFSRDHAEAQVHAMSNRACSVLLL